MSQSSFVFPVVHSILDPMALLREVTTHYDIGSPVKCVLLRSWINEVYHVKTSRGDFILKVFRHGWRAFDEVAYEVQLMQHLASCGITVQTPIQTHSGKTIQLLSAPEGQRPVVLYPMLLGKPALPPSDTVYHQVGHAIAQMHQALDSFVPTHPRRALDIHYLAHEPLSWLQPYFNDRQDDWRFLVALVERVQSRLTELEQTRDVSWGAIHGDATLDNLLITKNEQIGIYDFDQSGPGWRAYELQGVFYWAWESNQPSFWVSLLQGYNAVRSLSKSDIAAMPCFPVLNKLWCMGFEAHVIAQNNGQWIINESYFDERVVALRQWAAAHGDISVTSQA